MHWVFSKGNIMLRGMKQSLNTETRLDLRCFLGFSKSEMDFVKIQAATVTNLILNALDVVC